ncbi:GNAT family N-acetyltransferase [Risungbinella massiliensis]|uniref:GNAT family N-acetyltransferase n=1 Tax=Risungbinella massiliensis TaxID=1329796 RepID=UPI0005CC8816|nr:GNAT family N-acetyltransferase [Risungbinella massiliensis]
MIVYQATQADLKGVAPLFDQYRVFYEQPSDLPGAQQFLLERLIRQDSVLFVAVAEGEYLGFTQLYPSFSSVSMQHTWILNDLFVSSGSRGQGIATKLMEKAKEYAIATGAKSLSLQTAQSNLSAQRLYESQGYVKDEEFYSYELLLGEK